MTLSERAEKYADALWNSSDPKDWAWDDAVRDYSAGFKEAVALAAEIVQSHAEGGNIENYGHLDDRLRALAQDAPPGACL